MFFQIFVVGLYVAMGVAEEKASRVVEVLPATITPLHLLWGEILGFGFYAVMYAAAGSLVSRQEDVNAAGCHGGAGDGGGADLPALRTAHRNHD